MAARASTAIATQVCWGFSANLNALSARGVGQKLRDAEAVESEDRREVSPAEGVVGHDAGRQHQADAALVLTLSENRHAEVEVFVIGAGDDLVGKLVIECPPADSFSGYVGS